MNDSRSVTPPPSTGIAPPPSLSARSRQEVTETVHRIMGEGITTTDASGFTDPPSDHRPAGRVPAAGGDASTADIAKDQAGQVAGAAKQAGAQVAETVQEQAAQVTAEAGHQAKKLLVQAQSELSEQAAATQGRVADGLRALAQELHSMVQNSEQAGPATDLTRQAADKADQAARWLANRDPGGVLEEIRSFARHRPGTYLAIAVGAGVLAGRLTRGLAAPADSSGAAPGGQRTAPSTVAPPTPTVVVPPAATAAPKLPGALPDLRGNGSR